MRELLGKAACSGGLLVCMTQVFTLEASPMIFLVGLAFAFWGGLAAMEHEEEREKL